MLDTASRRHEPGTLFQPLDVMRSPTAEGIGRQWLLATSMARLVGQAGSDQLEEITGMSKSYCRRLENASWRIWAVTRAGRPPVEVPRRKRRMSDERHRRGAGIPLQREAISEPAMEEGANYGSLPSWPADALSMALPHIEPPPLLQRAPTATAAAVEREAIEPPHIELPQSMATGLGGKRRLDLPAPKPEPALPAASLLQQVTMAALAGNVAGSASRVVAHPLDTLRVLHSTSAAPAALEAPLLQRVAAAGSSGLHALSAGVQAGLTAFRASTGAIEPVAQPLYDLRQLNRSIGILYRGFGVSVLGAAPVNGLYFGGFEVTKRLFERWFPGEQRKDARAMAAGFAAECTAATLWVPWEVVRQRMQLSGRGSFSEVASEIVAAHGWRGLYVGTREYMMMWGMYSPIMLVCYERGMAHVAARRRELGVGGPPSAAASFAVGCTSGFVASIVTSPIDLVKTRMQCWAPESPYQYEGMSHGLREVVRTEGLRGLFRGAAPRACTMSLSVGVLMTSYHTLKTQGLRKLGVADPGQRPQA